MSDQPIRPITVDELIQLLSNLTPEDRAKPVELEGCDCTGPAYGIDTDEFRVHILRCHPVYDYDADDPVKPLGWEPM